MSFDDDPDDSVGNFLAQLFRRFVVVVIHVANGVIRPLSGRAGNEVRVGINRVPSYLHDDHGHKSGNRIREEFHNVLAGTLKKFPPLSPIQLINIHRLFPRSYFFCDASYRS
ncbi:hypothetical protein RAH42_07645 [Pyramidobacter sp. YE332]|uniref:hypothetical protein n=1 Tax=Pyramidobacter sp. YE332 TaxID=3068894 RepID=UPI00294B37FE|nr:hypothetical protein [Pyramidobacter sp. YE332]WOL41337.1 hypothetical protein RAH42_07645 [Pyramidobacter sp. YE332]